jgi:hypothetical protein
VADRTTDIKNLIKPIDAKRFQIFLWLGLNGTDLKDFSQEGKIERKLNFRGHIGA